MKYVQPRHLAFLFACGAALLPALFTTSPARSQYDVGPGQCVDAPGIPCADQDPSYRRTYIDPGQREAERRAREAEREEQRRITEVRRRNRTPYKGVKNHQSELRKSIGINFPELTAKGSAQLKAVTYERVPGYSGEIFVPDAALGDIVLARPVNPTLTETRVSAEQLVKAGAVMNFLNTSRGSTEDAAFLADQAMQIMVGGRSYVHVEVNFGSDGADGTLTNGNSGVGAFEERAREVADLLNEINAIQRRIRQSEVERGAVLKKAQGAIFELAGLREKVAATPAGRGKEKMEARSAALSLELDALELAYFMKVGEENNMMWDDIADKKKTLIRRVQWKSD